MFCLLSVFLAGGTHRALLVEMCLLHEGGEGPQLLRKGPRISGHQLLCSLGAHWSLGIDLEFVLDSREMQP